MDTVKRIQEKLLARVKKDPVIFYGLSFCVVAYLVSNPILDYYKNWKFENEAKKIYDRRMKERVVWKDDMK